MTTMSRNDRSVATTIVAGHHDHQPLDDVAQLADVAGPAIGLQDAQRVGSNCFGRRPYSRANSATKCSASRRMSSPRSRRGGTKIGMTLRRKYRSSRKPARPDLLGQILVGRGEDADVHAHAGVAADRLDDLLLQRAQHLGLRLQAHVADFVEKQRAAGRHLELAAAVRHGAGERAPCAWPNSSDSISSSGIAAQLTSTNGPARRWLSAWICRATSSLPVPFSPEISTRPLVGAAIAICSRSAAMTRLSPTMVERAVDAGAQRRVLHLEPALPQGVAHGEHGLFERQRLLDEVERAELRRAHGRLDAAVAGDHDDLRVDAPLAQPLERRQPVEPGQPDVEQDDVVGLPRHLLEARFAAVDGVDRVALVAQHAAERRAHARFVVDDQDGGHQCGGGKLDDREHRAVRRGVADLDAAAVLGDDPPDDRQAEPAAAALGRVVGHEQLLAIGGRHAGAVVGDDEPHDAVRAIVAGRDDDHGGRPSGRAGAEARPAPPSRCRRG